MGTSITKENSSLPQYWGNSLPMLGIKARRQLQRIFRFLLASVGRLLPFQYKLRLARRSSKAGYLLYHAGDFVLPDYLGDLKFHINTRNTLERVVLSGAHEHDLAHVVEEYVHEGDTCIDVGANVGVVSLLLAKKVGPRGMVHCFEPGPRFFDRLRQNMELNPSIRAQLQLHQEGVSDKTGTLHWAEDPVFPGNAGLLSQKGLRVPVVTLDEKFKDHPEHIHFLKIDVEGMELEVLKGAKQLILRHRPTIFLETDLVFETARALPIRKWTESFLKELGYAFYRVDANGTAYPVRYPQFPNNSLALPV